jgi:CoA:oxalate CoA-transferase
MGRPELIDDPRAISNLARVANREVVKGAINDWLTARSGIDEALRLLQGAHIPHAPILTVEQAMVHPHLRERRTVRTIRDRIIGEFQVPGFPLRFSEFSGELDLEAPFLGEHSRRILTEYLGYTDSQIDQLECTGALKSAPTDIVP